MGNRYLYIFFLSILVFGFYLHAQGLGFTYFPIVQKPFSELSHWKISQTFEPAKTNSLTLSVPFQYPMEARLHPEIQTEQKTEIESKTIKNLKIIVHNNLPALTDKTQNYLLPLYKAGQVQETGIVFLYLNQKFGLDFDFSFQIAGTQIEPVQLENFQSKLTLSYRIANNLIGYQKNISLEALLQLSGREQSVFIKNNLKKNTFSSKRFSNRYISPGFRLKTRNFMLEGLVEMPIDLHKKLSSSSYPPEYLYFSPELQGRLGMKWYFP